MRQTHDGDGRVAHVQVAGASLTGGQTASLSVPSTRRSLRREAVRVAGLVLPPPAPAAPAARHAARVRNGCACLQTAGCRSSPVCPPADATSGYLSLLDADFDGRPASPCLARAVNYTVRFRAVRCLLWDTGEWASGGPSPQPGTSPDRVSCRYDLR